jgi:hypothetical protein
MAQGGAGVPPRCTWGGRGPEGCIVSHPPTDVLPGMGTGARDDIRIVNGGIWLGHGRTHLKKANSPKGEDAKPRAYVLKTDTAAGLPMSTVLRSCTLVGDEVPERRIGDARQSMNSGISTACVFAAWPQRGA